MLQLERRAKQPLEIEFRLLAIQQHSPTGRVGLNPAGEVFHPWDITPGQGLEMVEVAADPPVRGICGAVIIHRQLCYQRLGLQPGQGI